ncbi:MAG: hypothetical protein ACPGVD_10685 [Flavobacteriales bacterium]
MKILETINRNSKLIFIGLLALTLISKFITLINLSFLFFGGDDLVFWQVAHDYSNGLFIEPFMYGQNYNYAIESILAVPLLKLGMPFQYAMPLTTMFVGILPFLFFAFVLFRKGWVVPSYIFLVIPLAMPIEYDIMTTITRGFVNGLFFSSFLVIPLLEPKSYKSYLLFGLMASLGYVTNPNSVVFSFPVGLYLFFNNYNTYKFYLIVLLSAVLPLCFFHVSKGFYIDNPDYLVHEMWELTFSFKRIWETLNNLNRPMQYLNPVFWSANWWVLPIVLLLSIYLLKRDWKMGLSVILGIVFIVVSFGINKVEEGIGVVFFSASRMFFAVPILLGLVLAWLIKTRKYNVGVVSLFVLSMVMLILKFLIIDSKVIEHTSRKSFGPVAIESIEVLKDNCCLYQELAKKHDADLIVFSKSKDANFSQVGIYNYGCPLLSNDFPETSMLGADRRNLTYKKHKSLIPKNVLLINYDYRTGKLENSGLDYSIIENRWRVVIIRNNQLKLPELSKKLGLSYDRNP